MTEVLVILVIGLLVLGPKRLPELARSLGRGLSEFRRASNEMRREFLDVADDAKIGPLDLDEPDTSEDAPAKTPLVQPSDDPEPEPESKPDFGLERPPEAAAADETSGDPEAAASEPEVKSPGG